VGEGLNSYSYHMTNVERFDLDRNVRRMILFSFWVFVFFILLSISLPFTPNNGRPMNPVFVVWLSFFGTAFFGILACYSWRFIRDLPYTSVSLDEHGIWQSAKSRDTALVPWSNIVKIKERPYLQRLELLGRSGQVLSKIEYQLSDFKRLRDIVIERSALVQVRMPHRDVFSKGFAHHLFYGVLLIGFTSLCIYIWPTQPVLSAVGFPFIVGPLAWEYLTTVHTVKLLSTELAISWPLRKLVIDRSEVISLYLSDISVNHSLHPQVLLKHTKSRKPIALRGIGVAAIELKQAINLWKSGE
jgi:hypothetical protein